VILHNVFSIDEAHNKALNIERLQNRTSLFRRSRLIEKSTSGAGVQPSTTMVDQPPIRQSTNAYTSAPEITIVAAAKSKEISYTKLGVDKYY